MMRAVPPLPPGPAGQDNLSALGGGEGPNPTRGEFVAMAPGPETQRTVLPAAWAILI